MKKRILLASVSLVLLVLPWQGAPGYTLLVAFVPLLLLRDELVAARRRVWPWVLAVLAFWSALSVWWVGNSILLMGGSAVAAVAIDAACVAVTTFVVFWPFMAYHYVRQRATRALAYAVLVSGWVGYEFVFLHGEITFPWLVLGNGFANSVEAVQWYEYTGALGGSVWVWICNITIYEAILAWKTRRARSLLAPVAWVALPLLASLVLFYTYDEPRRPVRVQLIQPNFDPHEKFETLTFDQQLEQILRLAEQAPPQVDYLVAPETALDERIAEEGIDADRYVRQIRHLLAARYPLAGMVIGATTSRVYHTEADAPWTAQHLQYPDHSYWFDVYNTALAIDTARVYLYHKSRLVAGAEMIPYLRQLPFLKQLSVDLGGSSGQFGVDERRSVFRSATGVRVGTPICWEAVFGEYTADFVREGAQALFVISNDAWWGNTAGHRQLFAFSRLRAIETRRAIARSANTGLSGFIDQRGRVLRHTEWDTRVSLGGAVNLNDRITLYVRFGDAIGRVAVLVFALSALYYVAWRRKKKDRLVG